MSFLSWAPNPVDIDVCGVFCFISWYLYETQTSDLIEPYGYYSYTAEIKPWTSHLFWPVYFSHIPPSSFLSSTFHTVSEPGIFHLWGLTQVLRSGLENQLESDHLGINPLQAFISSSIN